MNQEALEGFVVGAMLVIVLFFCGIMGAVYKKESIAQQCDQFQAFEFQGAVYDCKRRVVGN